MLLCSDNQDARPIALANSWLQGGRTLIMSRPENYHIWANMIREVWPDAKISVFGNPRYNDSKGSFPADVEFKEAPEQDADFYITSYGALIWHNFFNRFTVDQTIVEELDSMTSINYKWLDAVRGIFHEIPRPLFLQNIYQLPKDSGRDILASLQTSTSKANGFIGNIVADLMWVNLPVAKPFGNYSIKDVESYLGNKRYSSFDYLKLLTIFGVSSHLLSKVEGAHIPMVFRDNTVQQAIQNVNRMESGLKAMKTRERDLTSSKGISMQTLVTESLQGSDSSETLVGRLMTSQWAAVKARHLKTIHASLTNRTTHCLFIADNPEIQNSLKLTLGPIAGVFDVQTAKRYQRSGLEAWKADQFTVPLSNLILTREQLESNPSLLQDTTFVFLASMPLNQTSYDLLKMSTNAHGVRIVMSVMDSTFEEVILRWLT
jgi:hypothetical protein